MLEFSANRSGSSHPQPARAQRSPVAGLALLMPLLLAACATPIGQAPVEDRTVAGRAPAPISTIGGAAGAGTAPAPAAAAAGAAAPLEMGPGFYTVKPGDALIRIGLDNGLDWRLIQRWNSIENPNRIEVGQVLRLVPPGVDPSAAVTKPVAPAGRAAASPSAGPATPSAVVGSTPAASATPTTPVPGAAPAAPSVPSVANPKEGDEDVNWQWPAAGVVAAAFDEAKTKGLAIAGKAGDPVFAAADGRVVYAGSALRGYGNLIIVKHNNTYLTAYAHNQALLVKEDQAVRRGQRIAEMGGTDADRVQLHFEIRRMGKPVDPAKLLPPR